MTNFFINFLAILTAIALLVGIHEFGHFLFAKLANVRIMRVSIGFGKPIWSCVKEKTEYVIGLLPFGGYVRLLDERDQKVTSHELKFAFNKQSCWKRFWIIFAGPLFNLLFAWLTFWIVFTAGIHFFSPTIATVINGSIAANAGIKPMDTIIQVNDRKTLNWGSIVMTLALNYGSANKATITVISKDTKQTSTHILNLQHWSLDKLHPSLIKSLGIIEYRPPHAEIAPNLLKFSPTESLWQSAKQIGFYFLFNIAILWKMLTGVISIQSLTGPFGLFSGIIGATQQGWLTYCFFLGWLSINLAVVNLLPIPGLDGAHLCYILFEAIFKKPVSVHVQVLALRLGIILLTLLMLQAVLNDILRLLK
jgi:regulator of sigma E protease